MPITASSWYESNPTDGSLYQGDVVGDIPVLFMPAAGTSWMVLRPSPPHTTEQVLAGQTPRALKPHAEVSRADAWQNGGEDLVMGKATRKAVIVVTQSCDLVRRNWIQVAPIYPSSTLDDAAKRASLSDNEIGYFFFLPANPPGMPEDSYAELSKLTSVHKSYLLRTRPSLRLTPSARALFQRQLSIMHGRPFSFSLSDRVPESGEYLCHNCFLSVGRIARGVHTAEALFGECPECGTDALWIQAANFQRT